MQLENSHVVTKFITEIDFKSSAKEGDIVEIGLDVTKFGTASLTLRCEVRNMMTRETIITIEKIVMVNLNSEGIPTAPMEKPKWSLFQTV